MQLLTVGVFRAQLVCAHTLATHQQLPPGAVLPACHDCHAPAVPVALATRHTALPSSRAGHELQLAEDVFKLQHLLECNILRHRDELEEITGAAVKEEQIEVKLAAIESDWAALNLVRMGGLVARVPVGHAGGCAPAGGLFSNAH